jgi:hypothetical protein
MGANWFCVASSLEHIDANHVTKKKTLTEKRKEEKPFI